MALDDVHGGGREEQDDQKQRKHARQCLGFDDKDALELFEPWGILGKLKDP